MPVEDCTVESVAFADTVLICGLSDGLVFAKLMLAETVLLSCFELIQQPIGLRPPDLTGISLRSNCGQP